MKKYFAVLGIFSLLVFSCTKEGDGFGGFSNDSDSFGNFGGDRYNSVPENPFVNARSTPFSTFSVDADGASYANVRAFMLRDNSKPPIAAVRTEELINYFNLDYPDNNPGHSISTNSEVSTCPWNTNNKLLRIGLKGKKINGGILPASNFVLLIDVSGSMLAQDKLEILKNGFNALADGISDKDRVAIVTYAGKAEVLLESTPGSEKSKIKAAINSLGAGGGTAGAQGIVTAYEIAQENFMSNGNNRIVLGTDGDFNIGISSQDELVRLIEAKRELGVYLTVLGVGRGNLNDAALEQIANKGNGTYEYIDSFEQIKKVFVYEYNKFFAVAKDVKIQVRFNPDLIEQYRLIGYENRVLEQEDFDNDSTDAGEISSEQNITALYEMVPTNVEPRTDIPFMKVNVNYKDVNNGGNLSLEIPVFEENKSFQESSDFMKFTTSVAAFSQRLRGSNYINNTSYDEIGSWLNNVNLADEHGFKQEFKTLIQTAKSL